MTEPTLIGLCIFVYMGSWVLYLLHVAFRKKAMGLAGDVGAVVGLLLQTLSIGVRWMESHRMGIGHAPLSNLYESMIFFAWTIALITHQGSAPMRRSIRVVQSASSWPSSAPSPAASARSASTPPSSSRYLP